jgi:hypothetical protein
LDELSDKGWGVAENPYTITIGARGAIPQYTIKNLVALGIKTKKAKALATRMSLTAIKYFCKMIRTRRHIELSPEYISHSALKGLSKKLRKTPSNAETKATPNHTNPTPAATARHKGEPPPRPINGPHLTAATRAATSVAQGAPPHHNPRATCG